MPEWLAAMIERLLEKSPEDRFQSADEVAGRLEDCLAHVQYPDTVSLPTGPDCPVTHRSRPVSRPLKRPLLVVVVCVAVLLVGIFSGPFFYSLLNGKSLASASDDATVRLWSMGTGRQQQVLFGPDQFHDVTFSPDGSKVAGGTRLNTISIWRRTTGRLLHDYVAHWGRVYSLRFVDDQTLVSLGNDNQLRTWDLEKLQILERRDVPTLEPKQTCNFPGEPPSRVFSVAVSDDGRRLVAFDFHGTGAVWDLQTGRKLSRPRQIQAGGDTMLHDCVDFLPSGDWVTRSGFDTLIRRWDANTLHGIELLRRLGSGHFALSPDGRSAAITDWRSTSLDVVELEPRQIRSGPTFAGLGKPQCPSFSSDGSRVVVPTHLGHVVVIDAETLDIVQSFQHGEGYTLLSEFSPEGDILVVGGESIKLWDASTFELVAELNGFSDTALAVAFSPDGQFIVGGSGARPDSPIAYEFDGHINIWDRETRSLLFRFSAHVCAVAAVVFTPDGKSLITGGYDGKICIWDFQELLAHAQSD